MVNIQWNYERVHQMTDYCTFVKFKLESITKALTEGQCGFEVCVMSERLFTGRSRWVFGMFLIYGNTQSMTRTRRSFCTIQEFIVNYNIHKVDDTIVFRLERFSVFFNNGYVRTQ